ncbi:hypothetical protein [Histidinibacterium lentulum]|uniref:hypothetical protein n=1 Tax=Histidinibacterium lentulum TaxID=2480588 RepID=UPI000F4CAE4E|nr:hypothetical protein [Histidinibacterium lentulum]
MRRSRRTGREGRLAELWTDLAAFGLGGVLVAWCLLNAWVLGNMRLFGYDTLGYAGVFLLLAGVIWVLTHIRNR